jgi:hypothetical protein
MHLICSHGASLSLSLARPDRLPASPSGDLHGRIRRWRRGQMAKSKSRMIRVLLDDSGSADSPRVCIGGGFTTIGQWERFDDQWRGALGNTIFHMADFEGKNDPNNELLPRLLTIMNAHIMFYVGASSPVEARISREPTVKPYHDAAIACIQTALREAGRIAPSEAVEIILESSPGLTGPIIDPFVELCGKPGYETLVAVGRQRKGVLRGLEAADIVAYEYARTCQGENRYWWTEYLRRNPNRFFAP